VKPHAYHVDLISDVSGQNISVAPHQYNGPVIVHHHHGNFVLFQNVFFCILVKKENFNIFVENIEVKTSGFKILFWFASLKCYKKFNFFLTFVLSQTNTVRDM
jgi:hypothetical protein